MLGTELVAVACAVVLAGVASFAVVGLVAVEPVDELAELGTTA